MSRPNLGGGPRECLALVEENRSRPKDGPPTFYLFPPNVWGAPNGSLCLRHHPARLQERIARVNDIRDSVLRATDVQLAARPKRAVLTETI